MRLAFAACMLLAQAAIVHGCSATRGKQTQASPTPTADASSGASVDAVEATVVFTDCPSVSKAHNWAAERTVDRLVKDCTSVPGGEVRFNAVLEPGGKIDIQTPRGDNEGVVPMCVLKHQLRHNMWLKKPCRMDVKLEERGVPAE